MILNGYRIFKIMDKKQKDIPEIGNLNYKHLENMFVVKQDENENYYYDLTDSIFFNPNTISPLLFETYDVLLGDNLYNISRKFFETVSLWWMIGVINDIDNPYDLSNMVGESIKIPIKSVVGEVLTRIIQ